MKTQCPNCKAKFNVNEKNTGKKTKCPNCAQPFTIEPFVMAPLMTQAAPPVKTAAPPVTPVESPAKTMESPVATVTKIAEPIKAAETPVEEKPEPKKLSKTVYVYCWSGAQIIAGVLGALGLILALRKGDNSTLIATLAAADVFLVCSILIELALYYKMWSAIQDGEASVSPATAAGLLLIPVFNIYWALYMFTGFAEDYNAFIRRHSVTAKDLSFVLFFVYAVAFALSATFVIVPMIGVLTSVRLIGRAFIAYRAVSWFLASFAIAAGVSHFITYILIATKTCGVINALQGKSAVKT